MKSEFQIVQEVIRLRKTEKVLADPGSPVEYTAAQLSRGDNLVKQAIQDSGFAPFHYDRKCDGLAEPWRVYWLDRESCLRLATALPGLIPSMKPNNKLPALLSACGSLALYTWLPQTGVEISDSRKLQRVNREHLAATAAAVQNLLLLLTATGIGNYWASGELLADHVFSHFGIDPEQVLTAAVFANYPRESESDERGLGGVQVLDGKQRCKRSATFAWLSEIRFDA